MPATAVRPGIIYGKGLSGYEFVMGECLLFLKWGSSLEEKKRLVLSDVTSKIDKILHEILVNTF